jgi:hypothetical protein
LAFFGGGLMATAGGHGGEWGVGVICGKSARLESRGPGSGRDWSRGV